MVRERFQVGNDHGEVVLVQVGDAHIHGHGLIQPGSLSWRPGSGFSLDSSRQHHCQTLVLGRSAARAAENGLIRCGGFPRRTLTTCPCPRGTSMDLWDSARAFGCASARHRLLEVIPRAIVGADDRSLCLGRLASCIPGCVRISRSRASKFGTTRSPDRACFDASTGG